MFEIEEMAGKSVRIYRTVVRSVKIEKMAENSVRIYQTVSRTVTIEKWRETSFLKKFCERLLN